MGTNPKMFNRKDKNSTTTFHEHSSRKNQFFQYIEKYYVTSWEIVFEKSIKYPAFLVLTPPKIFRKKRGKKIRARPACQHHGPIFHIYFPFVFLQRDVIYISRSMTGRKNMYLIHSIDYDDLLFDGVELYKNSNL